MRNKTLITLLAIATFGTLAVGCGNKTDDVPVEVREDAAADATLEAETADTEEQEAVKSDTEEDPDFTVDGEMMVEPSDDVIIPEYTITEESEEDGITTQIYENEEGTSIALYTGDDLSSQVFASKGVFWQIGYEGNTQYRITTDGADTVYSIEWTDEDGMERRLSAPEGMDYTTALSTLHKNLTETDETVVSSLSTEDATETATE